jgi:4-hydroxy-tetrahydrodipicolinate reductase
MREKNEQPDPLDLTTPPRLAVAISGLPGRMAALVAQALAERRLGGRVRLAETAFSSAKRAGEERLVASEDGDSIRVRLAGPPTPEALLRLGERELDRDDSLLVVVDYSSPSCATANALAYAAAGVPYVMGTTGLDVDSAREAAMKAGIPAVAAPNMAVPIVLLGAALEWTAMRFPGAFAGMDLSIRESHQAAKKDVSGTARKFLGPLSRLAGTEPDEAAAIESIRDAATQRALGIPEEALGGHAWHRYELKSPDGALALSLEHVALGRSVYVDGTLRALRFLSGELAVRRGAGLLGRPGQGALFGMEDVLAGTG